MVKYYTNRSFLQKYKSEQACMRALMDFRLGDKKCCPRCNHPFNIGYTPIKGKRAFICKRCLLHIYPQAGTGIFERSHVPLKDWFEIIFAMLYRRNGISANEIHRTYGYAYPTAYRILLLIRLQMRECLDFDLSNSVVEIDEAAIPTGNKSLSKHYKGVNSRGRGTFRHSSILTIVERGGVCKLYKIPATDSESIIPIILAEVPKSTIIYTDSYGVYNKLKSYGYVHLMVNHKIKEYTRDSASTNSAESVFGNFKRSLAGTWRNISDGKLETYLNLHAFQHSYRNLPDYGFEIFMQSLPKIEPTNTQYLAA